MTRLVGVRAVCDGCSAAAAVIFCVAHRTVLCQSCDASHHATPETADHQRVDLQSAVTALPFCEYCDDAPATTYCESEGTTLCDKCDRNVHASHPLAHYRTSISSTLRNRAVEFRGKPKNKTARKSQTPRPKHPQSDNNNQTSPKSQQQPSSQNPPSTPTATTQPHQRSSPVRRPPVPSAQPRAQPLLKKRCSKLLAKRKHRRDAEKVVSQSSTPNPPSDNSLPSSRPPDLVVSTEYPTSLFPVSSHPEDLSPPAHASHPHFSVDLVSSTQVLNDPLLMDPNLQFRQNHDRHHFAAEPAAYGHDLNNMIRYGTIDFSGDTAVEGLNDGGRSVSASASGASTRRQTPDFDVLPHNGRVMHGRGQVAAPPTSMAAVAAAAAAAGEMYLLHSASSGSGASRERFTPPLNDPTHVPDPAGVAEAATAAAAAAVGSATDAGDLGGASGMPPAVLSSRPSHITTDAAAEALQQSNSWEGRSGRLLRRESEPIMPTVPMNTAGDHVVLASQPQPVDEAMRKLEVDGGDNNQLVRFGTRGETSLSRHDQELLTSQGESNMELLPSVTEGEDVLRRGSDGIGDLEMPRDEFGMFDSIDLSHFEHNTSGSLPFSLHEYRGKALDSDDG